MIEYRKTVGETLTEIETYEPNCWVNVIAPDESEKDWLRDQMHVDPEYIRSSLDEGESSHTEREDDCVFLIFDVPCIESNSTSKLIYSTMPVGIVVTSQHVITISSRSNIVIDDLSRGAVRGIHTEFHTQFVLQLLLRMTTHFLAYLRQIDRSTSNLETKLRHSMQNRELAQLLDLKKSLVYFQTSLKANDLTIQKLMRGRMLRMYDDDQDLLDDVRIEMQQAIEMCSISTGILTSTMDAFSSLISNNLNFVMKVLTSITILMAIPTMIFSFYGMNIGETAGSLPLASNMIFVSVFTVVATGIVGFILYKKNMF